MSHPAKVPKGPIAKIVHARLQREKILEDPSDPKSITISKIHQILNESTTQCVRTTDLDLSTPNQHSIHRETTENPTPSGSGHFPTSTQTLLWETTLQNPSLPSGKLNLENPNTTSGSDDNTTYSTAYLEKLETPTPKKRIGEINLKTPQKENQVVQSHCSYSTSPNSSQYS